MDDLEDSAWESWLRPLTLIALAAGAVGVWWFELLPDPAVGLIIAIAAWAVGAIMAFARLRAGVGGGVWRLQVGLFIVLAGIGSAAWIPAQLATESTHVASAIVPHSGAQASIASYGIGPARYLVHLNAAPKAGQEITVEMRVTTTAEGDSLVIHKAHLVKNDDNAPKKPNAKKPKPNRSDGHWTNIMDLSQGATATVSLENESRLNWPVHIGVRRVPSATIPVTLGALLILLGLILDRTQRSVQRGRMAVFAATCMGAGLVFERIFTPGQLTLGVFGALVLGTLLGGLIALPLNALVGRSPKAPKA